MAKKHSREEDPGASQSKLILLVDEDADILDALRYALEA